MNASYRRLFVASAFLLVLFAAFCVIDEVLALRNSITFQSFFADVENQKGSTNSDGVVVNPESLYSTMTKQYEQPLPNSFQEEFFEVQETSEYFVGADGCVVGIRFESSASETLSLVTEKMREKGWIVIESGGKTQASFVKSSGCYSYTFLECFDDSLGCLAVFTLGSGG